MQTILVICGLSNCNFDYFLTRKQAKTANNRGKIKSFSLSLVLSVIKFVGRVHISKEPNPYEYRGKPVHVSERTTSSRKSNI